MLRPCSSTARTGCSEQAIEPEPCAGPGCNRTRSRPPPGASQASSCPRRRPRGASRRVGRAPPLALLRSPLRSRDLRRAKSLLDAGGCHSSRATATSTPATCSSRTARPGSSTGSCPDDGPRLRPHVLLGDAEAPRTATGCWRRARVAVAAHRRVLLRLRYAVVVRAIAAKLSARWRSTAIRGRGAAARAAARRPGRGGPGVACAPSSSTTRPARAISRRAGTRSPSSSRRPFCSPAWMLAWWRHAAPEEARSCARSSCSTRSELVGVAPFFASAAATYRLLGCEASLGLQPLAAPGADAEVAAHVAGALADARPRPDVIGSRVSAPTRSGRAACATPGRGDARLCAASSRWMRRASTSPVAPTTSGGPRRPRPFVPK